MARRVNKKFLTIVTIVICAALVAAMLGRSFIHHGAGHYIEIAQKAEASGDLQLAASSYGNAYYRNHNPDYLLKQADLFIKLTATDPQFLNNAVSAWRTILENDPQNVPALQHMVNLYAEEAQHPPVRPQVLNDLTDYATHLHEADPSNEQAAAWLKMAPVAAYLGGVATDPVKLEHQVNDLQKVVDADPGNTYAELLIAEAHLRLSETAGINRDMDEATRQRQLAVSTFDVPLKKQPNNPAIWLRAAQISYNVMHALDLQITSSQQAGALSDDTTKTIQAEKQLRAQCADDVHQGEKLLTTSNPQYEELAMIAIGVEAGLNNGPVALKLTRELLAARPDSLPARLEYARVMQHDPSQWHDVERVLAAPVNSTNNPTGLESGLLKSRQIIVMQQLTELRCDLAEIETDPAKKATLIAEVQEGYDKLKGDLGETPETLKLQGRIQLLQGKTVQAVQTLEKAQTALQHAGGFDANLALVLSNLYLEMGQTGDARKLLKQVIDSDPTNLQPRLKMVQLLERDNDLSGADSQLSMIERVDPHSLPVIAERIQLDLLQKNLDHAKKLYAKFPEDSDRNSYVKAQFAAQLKNYPDAIRLVSKLHDAHPDQINYVKLLVKLYTDNNQRDQAIQLANQALAAHPTDPGLKVLTEQASATNAQARQQILEQATAASLTPPQKELIAYEIAIQQGKIDEAASHLDKAEQLAPNDPRILEERFHFLLAQKKFDQAQAYVDRLVKATGDASGGLVFAQQIALFQGHFDQAIDLANQIIAKLPEFADGYSALGLALQYEGRYQEAVDKYLQALERRSNDVRSMRGLIDCYYALNRPQDAQRYITMALQADPNAPDLQEFQVNHSLKYGDATFAITARQKQLDADPNNAGLVEDLALAYLSAANYQIQHDNASSAQPYIDKVQKLITDGMQRWPDNRDFFKLSGQLALLTKDYAAGEAAMNRMVAQPQWNNDPATYLTVSDFYRQAGKLDKAEAAMREAIDKGGGAEYRLQLADLLSMRQQPDQALALLEPMIDTDAIRAERVTILIAAKRDSQALPILQTLIDKNPNNPKFQRQLLEIEAAQGNVDQLMSTATAMLAKNPKDTTALYYRGQARYKHNPPDVQGAQADLEAVLQDDPSNVDARFWLADIYRQRNDWDSAISQLQQALSAQPDNTVVRLKLIDFESSTTPPRWSDVEQLINTALSNPQNQNDATWQRAAGNMWLRRGNANQALAAYQAAIKISPKDPSLFHQYVDALIWAQQPDQAISLTDAASHQSNCPAWVHEDRATAYAKLNQADKAKAEILAALSSPDVADSALSVSSYVAAATSAQQLDAVSAALASKNSAGPRWKMMAAYIEHVRHNEGAAADFMDQVALSPGDLTASEKLDAARWGSMLNMTRQPPDYEKAVQMAKLAVSMQPDSLDQLNNLACMLVDSVKPPRPAEALQYSQHAYDLMRKSGTNDPLIQDTQGWVLVNNGQVQNGMLILRQLVDSTPFIDAYYHLAEAYLRSNQPGPALTQLKLASQTLEDLKKNKQAFDPTLPARIQAAQDQAKEMSKMQASAPH